MKAVKIPYDQLSTEALQGVVEEFVTRDGTDYGEVEMPLETKIAQVMAQIRSGKAVIVFDQETESCTILRSDDPLVEALESALVEVVGAVLIFVMGNNAFGSGGDTWRCGFPAIIP